MVYRGQAVAGWIWGEPVSPPGRTLAHSGPGGLRRKLGMLVPAGPIGEDQIEGDLLATQGTRPALHRFLDHRCWDGNEVLGEPLLVLQGLIARLMSDLCR